MWWDFFQKESNGNIRIAFALSDNQKDLHLKLFLTKEEQEYTGDRRGFSYLLEE